MALHDLVKTDFHIRAVAPLLRKERRLMQRGPIPSQDPVYSEADVADMRERWEQAEKERRTETQLSNLAAAFVDLPARIEEIARRVVLQVLAEQRHEREKVIERRASWVGVASGALQALTALGILFLALKAAHVF